MNKFQPHDGAEKTVVREITNAQWANLRIDRARKARLNAEAAALGGDIKLACEAAYAQRTMVVLRQEHAAHARLIAQGERRLKQMKRDFAAAQSAQMSTDTDRTNVEPR